MKVKNLLIMLALIVFLSSCATTNTNDSLISEPASPIIKEFNLSVGQTKEEIISLYGKPDKIAYQELLKNGTKIEVLDYSRIEQKFYDKWWVTEVYRLTFKDGKLVKIETCVPAAPVKID